MKCITRLKTRLWALATYLKVLRNFRLPAWRRYVKCWLNQLIRQRGKPNTLTKHLVILAWEFPPTVSAGVYRPASFARYASEQGWRVTVICGALPDKPTSAGTYLTGAIPDSVEVHYVTDTPIWPHPSPLTRIDGGIGNALNVYEKACAILEDLEPGIILASGPPFNNFIAATWLARRFGWKLVLDYRDEWTNNPFEFTMKDKVNAKWEAHCLRHADHVIFTTQSQLEYHGTRFPSLIDQRNTSCDRGSVIFNGWEPRDFSNQSTNVDLTPLQGRKLSLAFFGNLGPAAHPEEFLATMSKVYDQHPSLLETTQIIFVGFKQPIVLEQLENFPYPDNLLLIDQVSKAEAVVMMREADALLLLNTTALFRYIGGKLYDYLASKTPILFYGEGGEMATIVENLKAGIVIPYSDPAALTRAIESLQCKEVKPDQHKIQWLQSRTRENQAKQLLSTLSRLVQIDPPRVTSNK